MDAVDNGTGLAHEKRIHRLPYQRHELALTGQSVRREKASALIGNQLHGEIVQDEVERYGASARGARLKAEEVLHGPRTADCRQ